MMANYKRKGGDLMGSAGALNDAGSVTQPVYSFWPNDYGLYCMAGNVNEWVMDVYRPLTFEDMEDFNPIRGNQFTMLEMDPATGTPVDKDSLGRMPRIALSEDVATTQRRQIKGPDYRNYLDGDTITKIPSMDTMYDPSMTLITNTIRVYKGGSWRDRAYWLSPGARRFLEENESKDDLGFRCAMTRVGAQTKRNSLIPTKK
jgi:formylglycine-generating enzyme required for sulfatase activity